MIVVNSLGELLQDIKRDLKILALDGTDGVGKTSVIAPFLETNLNAVTVHVDDYLEKNQGSYYQFLQLAKLKTAITSYSSKVVIVEGVLLIKIFKSMELKFDQLIYATEYHWFYKWTQDENYMKLSLSQRIKEEERLTRRLQLATRDQAKPYLMKGFRKEFYEYTFQYAPFKKADLIYIV